MAICIIIYALTCLDYEWLNLGRFLDASEKEEVHHAVYNIFNGTMRKSNYRKGNKTASIRIRNSSTRPMNNGTIAKTNIQQRIIGYQRLRPKATYLALPPPTNTTHPVSVGACCGIGHRLCFNIPTFVYAVQHERPIYAVWNDISWPTLFNDTVNIKASTSYAPEHYDNGYPGNWLEGIPEYAKAVMPTPGTSYAQYSNHFPLLFDMPLAQSIVHSLQSSLSATVLSFLSSIREQSYLSELHLCAHIREGNNETGDWEGKTWRHIDLHSVLNATLFAMEDVAEKRNANNVTVFVASDNVDSRKWFEDHVKSGWSVVQPTKVIEKPESGVWFGEHGSQTNSVLSQEQKNEAMAEAASDIFALGECDALFIPNYSSFTLISIMLMRAEKRVVSFMHTQSLEYVELPYPEEVVSESNQVVSESNPPSNRLLRRLWNLLSET